MRDNSVDKHYIRYYY